MTRLLPLALAASSIAMAAHAAPTVERVRGAITAADATSVTLHTADGADVKVAIGSDTKYLAVVKSAITAIQPNSFIGTATKGAGSRLTALEVVVFPPELRGMGEGHYAWDKLPDPSSGKTAGSTMTNGTVEAGGSGGVASSMTNGTIDTAADKDGTLKLGVSYKGGRKTILVPPGVPVVAFKVADHGVVKTGAQAFVIASEDAGKVTAKAVAVGQDGLKPPM